LTSIIQSVKYAIMNMEARKVELVSYTPMWKDFFIKECQNLEKILRKNIVEIHHIGSTAIPSIMAKPTLDILCVVHTMDGIELFKSEFEKSGLVWKGENGVFGRLYFERLAKEGSRHLCHVHIFEKGNSLIDDHLDFRDYLNAEGEVAKEYEKLKVELKSKYSDNPALYTAAKSEFIETILQNIR